MPKNVWPDFEFAKAARSPKSVIEELGVGLNEKTDDIVRFTTGRTAIRDNMVVLSFFLYTPSLRYQYPFLKATFPFDISYPVTLVADKMEDVTAHNEDELVASLIKIFSAPSTVQTIQKLVTLALEPENF